MNTQEILDRIEYLINYAHEALPTGSKAGILNYAKYSGFRAASLTFLISLFGSKSVYFHQFEVRTRSCLESTINSGIEILHAIKYDVEKGWLITVRQLIAGELFSDFLEMSKHLLDEGYKDAAAVMIGSVLEEHLRQLCTKQGIELTYVKGSDLINKKADKLNAELHQADVYSSLDQKSILAWLALRNQAAHGKYDGYTIENVKLMYSGVLNFVTTVN
jgi:hypothetical protein